MDDASLLTELRAVERQINIGLIQWVNSENKPRTCPFNAFSHTGKIAASPNTEDWKSAIAVQLRVDSEVRNGGSLASVRAGHQKKADTVSATMRLTGVKASESTVTVQLALAQSLADRARRCAVEINGRAERARQAAEIAAEVNKAREAKEAADKVKAAAFRAATAQAVKDGTLTVEEALELEVA